MLSQLGEQTVGGRRLLQRDVQRRPCGRALRSPVGDQKRSPPSNNVVTTAVGADSQSVRLASPYHSSSPSASPGDVLGESSSKGKRPKDGTIHFQEASVKVLERKFPPQKLLLLFSQALGPSGTRTCKTHAYSTLSCLHPSDVCLGGHPASSLMVLAAESWPLSWKRGELCMVQEASHWLGICFLYPLKPPGLLENFRC